MSTLTRNVVDAGNQHDSAGIEPAGDVTGEASAASETTVTPTAFLQAYDPSPAADGGLAPQTEPVVDAGADPSMQDSAGTTGVLTVEADPGDDAADGDEASPRPDDNTAADETTDMSVSQGDLESDVAAAASPPSPGDRDEATDNEERGVPLCGRQGLEALLDESMGELVAREDFDREVDDRANESHWLGNHSEHSLAAIREEHLRKGKCTAHVDDTGKLLSDPEEYRLAVEDGVRIVLCVHRARTSDQQLEFILRLQAGKRVLTTGEQRRLRGELIKVQLRLGVDYKSIAKMTGVHPNTVRNVETAAAADTYSKDGIAKKDRRFTWSTSENVAEANRLRATGMNNSEIARELGTTPATIGKLFKDPAAQATTNTKEKPDKTRKARATEPVQQAEDIAASDGVPELHRRALEHLKKNAQAYKEWMKDAAAKAQADVEAAAGDREEVLKLALRGRQLLTTANLWLTKNCGAGGEVHVEEASSGNLGPDEAPHAIGTILRGIVKDIKPDAVYVRLPSGRLGKIDNRDNGLAKYGSLKTGEEVRVRVAGFDSDLDLSILELRGRQTAAPAAGATAFGLSSDEGFTPAAEVATYEADAQNKEVI